MLNYFKSPFFEEDDGLHVSAANTEEVAAPQPTETLDTGDVVVDNGQSTETPPPQQPDITQTQAFAYRLKEEKQRARDMAIAEMGMQDPYSGEPITTEAQYKQVKQRQEYEEKGISLEDVQTIANQALNNNPLVQEAREIVKNQRLNDLKSKPFYAEVEPQLLQLAQSNPTLDLLGAYKYLVGERLFNNGLDDIVNNTKKQTEQETVRKLMNNAQSTPGALGAEATEHKTGYASLSKSEKEQFRQRVLRGENPTI